MKMFIKVNAILCIIIVSLYLLLSVSDPTILKERFEVLFLLASFGVVSLMYLKNNNSNLEITLKIIAILFFAASFFDLLSVKSEITKYGVMKDGIGAIYLATLGYIIFVYIKKQRNYRLIQK